MFHQGDLQSGIGLAIQESKSVVCFVTDDAEESNKWESEWLHDHNIPETLDRHAVALRIEGGSQEAGFLAAFCPIVEAPMLVVIYQGQLEERLLPGISKNDFTLRLLRAISRNKQSQPASNNTPSETPQIPSAAVAPSQSSPTNPPAQPVDNASQEEVQASGESAEPSGTPSAVQRMLIERRQRLEAEQKAREAAERAQRIEKEKARKQKAAEESKAQSSGLGANQSSKLTYAQEQVQRKNEAKRDRERILRQLENDKLERKEREERRRAAARAEAGQVNESTIQPKSTISSSKQGESCSLQIRLVDGSTIRSKFAKDDTLAVAVRKWIDENRTDGSNPYTLRQILTPMPNRALSTSDEHQTLQEAGLLPNATLIMVPVPGYSEAYAGYRTHFFGSTRDGMFGYVCSTVAAVIGPVLTFLGLGQEGMTSTNSASASSDGTSKRDSTGASTSTSAASVKIRTLRDQEREREDQQLYNGNQLNFEPNRKDDEDEDA